MKHKRIYISADIEGITGVVTTEQIWPKGFEYDAAREWMTAEVVSACNAAFACGVEEIVVSDSHGNAQNLLLDRMPENVQVVRSWPRPLGMMEGIQHGHFDAAFLLGYHPGATDQHGVLAHTFSGSIRELTLNGIVASETVVSAAIAGYFGVPVALTTGDDAYEQHVRSALGDTVETVVTKVAHGYTSATCRLPAVVCSLIDSAATAAIHKLDQLQPYVLNGPVTVEVDFNNREIAEKLDYLPNIKRLGTYRVQFIAQNMDEVSRFIMFVIMK